MGILFGIGVVIGLVVVITAVALGVTYSLFTGLTILGKMIVGGLRYTFKR